VPAAGNGGPERLDPHPAHAHGGVLPGERHSRHQGNTGELGFIEFAFL